MSRTDTLRIIIGFTVGIVIACGAVGCGPIHPAEPSLPPKTKVELAIMPRYGPREQGKKSIALAKYLRSETSYDVRPVSAAGYRRFLSVVESAHSDFAFVNPTAYVTLHKTRGARPLLMALELDFPGGPPQAQYRGVILVRTAAGINSVSDLRGKIIAASSEMAVAGHLAPKALCRQQGLDIDKEATVAVCATQEQVIDRLRRGTRGARLWSGVGAGDQARGDSPARRSGHSIARRSATHRSPGGVSAARRHRGGRHAALLPGAGVHARTLVYV